MLICLLFVGFSFAADGVFGERGLDEHANAEHAESVDVQRFGRLQAHAVPPDPAQEAQGFVHASAGQFLLFA